MLARFFILYLTLFSSVFASDGYMDKDIERLQRMFASFDRIKNEHRDQTADEILEKYKDQPEFMNCSAWLQKEHPDFVPEQFSVHFFYPLLVESIQLADFEVDTIEGFMHKYMETDMAREQGETLLTLRRNSMSAKDLVNQIIELLQNTLTVEQVLKHYFSSRLESIVLYQAELLGRKETCLDFSNVEKVARGSAEDPEFQLVHAAFMRGYNTKNKIMRTLLYYIKDQKPEPLCQRLPEDLLGLIKLSVTLHPYLNKENDQWIDYDEALSKGEACNFLRNSKALGINLQEFFKKEGITGYRIPKASKALSAHKLPSFFYPEIQSLDQLMQEFQNESKKNKAPNKRARKKAAAMLQQEKVEIAPEIQTPFLSPLDQTNASIDHVEPVPVRETVSILEIVSTSPLKEEIKAPIVSSIKNESLEATTKMRSKHITTIYDIFRPNGYSNLNDDKIIKAWEHVLMGKGYHKKNTGRSHQPLYAELDDGTRVILGLFRSSGYGKNYIEYIREAFDKIGFGRSWLEEQGYIVGK